MQKLGTEWFSIHRPPIRELHREHARPDELILKRRIEVHLYDYDQMENEILSLLPSLEPVRICLKCIKSLFIKGISQTRFIIFVN